MYIFLRNIFKCINILFLPTQYNIMASNTPGTNHNVVLANSYFDIESNMPREK